MTDVPLVSGRGRSTTQGSRLRRVPEGHLPISSPHISLRNRPHSRPAVDSRVRSERSRQISLFVWPDNDLPHRSAEDDVGGYRDRTVPEGDSHSLHEAGKRHRIANPCIGPRDDHRAWSVERQRCAVSVNDNRERTEEPERDWRRQRARRRWHGATTSVAREIRAWRRCSQRAAATQTGRDPRTPRSAPRSWRGSS